MMAVRLAFPGERNPLKQMSRTMPPQISENILNELGMFETVCPRPSIAANSCPPEWEMPERLMSFVSAMVMADMPMRSDSRYSTNSAPVPTSITLGMKMARTSTSSVTEVYLPCHL